MLIEDELEERDLEGGGCSLTEAFCSFRTYPKTAIRIAGVPTEITTGLLNTILDHRHPLGCSLSLVQVKNIYVCKIVMILRDLRFLRRLFEDSGRLRCCAV